MKHKPKHETAGPKPAESEVPSKEQEDLQARLDGLQKEKDELFERLQRISADYANYQKRVPKQISDSVGYEKERILKSLLPVLDNFEHTLQNAQATDNLEGVLKGIRITYDQMLDILKGHGVQQIRAKEQCFDPCQHEAMLQRSDPDKAPNLVLEEFQKGYMLNDRVIRPSKVIVNKAPSQAQAETGQPQAPQAEICDSE